MFGNLNYWRISARTAILANNNQVRPHPKQNLLVVFGRLNLTPNLKLFTWKLVH